MVEYQGESLPLNEAYMQFFLIVMVVSYLSSTWQKFPTIRWGETDHNLQPPSPCMGFLLEEHSTDSSKNDHVSMYDLISAMNIKCGLGDVSNHLLSLMNCWTISYMYCLPPVMSVGWVYIYYVPKFSHYAFGISPIFCLLCSFLCFLIIFTIYIYNCIFCIKTIMIGMKIMQVTRATTIIKCIKIDVSASLCSNFNS